MENEYYGLATTPTEDYLAHYGIKGMKWGVRKAIQRGNDRALSRQYRKAQKKLAKLERRANNGAKYARRAARLGVGAAAAGGLAALGTSGVSKGMQLAGKGIHIGAAKLGAGSTGNQIHKSLNKAAGAVNTWGAGNSIGTALNRGANSVIQATPNNITRAANKALKNSGHAGLGVQANKLKGVSNNTFARIGAGAIGAGLAGAAGYNAYRAATTKRAAAKAAAFRKEMNKQFAGTKYANAPRTPQKKRRRG